MAKEAATPAPAVAPAYAWQDKSPTYAILNLDVIVMQVIGRKADEFVVQSSHGQPVGEYSTMEAAKRYAVKFAGTMIEKTLAGLAEIESTNEVATIGYKGKPCHLLVLFIDPNHPDFDATKWTDENGEARPDVFEQHRQALIDNHRTNLRGLLAAINR